MQIARARKQKGVKFGACGGQNMTPRKMPLLTVL